MPNPKTMRVLDTDVVDFSTGSIDGTNSSNEYESSTNVLIIGMSNSKYIAD